MKVPLKVFSQENSIEESCIEQMKRVSSLPFLYHHTALMPDGHWGKGASIGSVIVTKNVVVPNLIGLDIGCGIVSVKTSLIDIDTETLKKIMGEIRKVIPVGIGKNGSHKEKQDENLMPDYSELERFVGRGVVAEQYQNALKQLASLGSGNHFIEIQQEVIKCKHCDKGKETYDGTANNDRCYTGKICKYCKGEYEKSGHIWIMIHSGSRNLGKQVADHYNKLAIQLNEKWHSSVPKEWQLAFLPFDSKEGQAYLREMNYCVDFALANRNLMMSRIFDICHNETGCSIQDTTNSDGMINIAHNYARMENHFEENVMVHRKGATLATKDTIGIIPGSQGTKSYIVKGKGNSESFNSCSHGAGRKMGRKEAERTLNLDEEVKRLDDQGILHAIRGKKDLDEASGAYKDIDVVMENQKDLVEILTELTPLAVIKG